MSDVATCPIHEINPMAPANLVQPWLMNKRLRDEAHRFAIGAHRDKRSKAIGAPPLDEVPGIGATRKRALLAHFGSAKAVSRADLADLKAVEGISDRMAETIYAFFHDGA